MSNCSNCNEPKPNCICDRLDVFFDGFDKNLKNIAVGNPVEKKRCLACFFVPCRCKAGLANKK